jgi:hypothetical protein
MFKTYLLMITPPGTTRVHTRTISTATKNPRSVIRRCVEEIRAVANSLGISPLGLDWEITHPRKAA